MRARLGRADVAATLQTALVPPKPGDIAGLVAVIATARALLTTAFAALPPDHPMTPCLQAGHAGVGAASDPEAALDDLRWATKALTRPDRRGKGQRRDGPCERGVSGGPARR